MAYLAPIHRPSSVRHALKLNFFSPEEECLVVAKASRLEFYALTVDGIVLKHARTIYGKVTMFERLRPASTPTEHLFVGTDRYTYFTLSWDPVQKQLRTEKKYVDQADKTGRDSQSADRCLIDPARRFMTLEIFEGILTVIPIARKQSTKGDIDIGNIGEPIPVRISELFVRSSTYLHYRTSNVERERPRLALLYEDNQQKARLKVRKLDYSAKPGGDQAYADFDEEQPLYDDVDLSASHLIPVSAPAYGFLILSETSITWIDEESGQTVIEPLKEATIFVVWEQVDPQRWLLADDYGHLYFLMLLLGGKDGEAVRGFKLDTLGMISRASVLVYLNNGYVFVGSHQGDSQLVRIVEGSLEVVQAIPNIAPILDFTVMDMGSRSGEGQTNEYSSGQARIVTGSGAFQDGSLRSVRSGVGLEELGSLGEMGHVTDLFSLPLRAGDEQSDVLIVSFIDETRIFAFTSDGEVEEAEDFKGFSLSETTLLATSLPQHRLLQCTRSFVRIVDVETGMVMSEWTAPSGQSIVAASSSENNIAISLGGIDAIVLDLSADLRIVSRRSFGAESQISCIDIPSIAPEVVIVGFWQSTSISVLQMNDLQEIQTTSVGVDAAAVPRSVLLTQILAERPPTLFVALADGNVVTFDVAPTDFSFSNRKSTILGTQQATLKALARDDGLYNVFATCEHPSLIYGSEGRLIYSAVTAERASCICSFNAAAYPGAIAIATPDDLKIALVDRERTTHVQTLPIGETVRRIAYSTNLKAFGMGTIKRTLKGGVEVVKSHFKLVDEIVFKELDTFELNEDELIESVARADLDEGTGKTVERFLVGTAYLEDEQPEAVRGRILVFEVTQDRMLKVVTKLAVKGACRALSVIDGRIVAALVKTVVVYAYEFGSLQKVATYRTSTAPIDISVEGGLIAIADIMKSVSIVQYTRGTAGESDKLTEVARHFQIAWSTAVAPVDENTLLESDAEGNLMVLHRNINGVTEDDRRRLEITSELQLGEMVNRIRRVNVPVSADSVVIPRAFMATVEGSIYLFALIRPDKQDLLMRLQSSIAAMVSSPGDMPFNKYRAFKNAVREADEPFRFVDGELIEKFLDCKPAVQEEILQGIEANVEDIRGMVEALRRLH